MIKLSLIRRLFLCLAALLFIGLNSQDSLAQATSPEKKPLPASKAAATQDTTGVQPAKPEKENLKIFLDKIEILGRIEKPQTVFILPGKDPAVDGIQIDRSFFKEIFRSIEKDDITRRHRQSPQ